MRHIIKGFTQGILGLALVISCIRSHAATTASYEANYTSASFYDSQIGVNLLKTGQSSLQSASVPVGSISGTFPNSGVNDGSGGANNQYTYYGVTDGVGMPVTITFQLTGGYDISSIKAFSGWSDHNLGAHKFELLLSIGGGAFTSYGTFTNNATVTTGSSAVGSYLTSLTDAGGLIASNVTGIRFVFSSPDTSNGVNAVGVLTGFEGR